MLAAIHRWFGTQWSEHGAEWMFMENVVSGCQVSQKRRKSCLKCRFSVKSI